MDALVRTSPNVSKLAKDVGTERLVLYRTFRGDKGPRLSMVVRVLSSAGFQLAVKAEEHSQEGKLNRFGQTRKACAKFLTRAFETSDTVAIVKALDDTLRAQENVVEFAKKASLDRSSLYRSFSPNRDPQFSTVVHFLRALGLRFAVVSLSPSR
jgi:probable addiction module antidote protein